MPQLLERAIIVGGGVSGLTSAVVLARAGWAVEVWSREPAERGTSGVAAALWYPYKAGPAQAVARWSFESLAEFQRLAADPTSGVRMRSGLELFPIAAQAAPWRACLSGVVPARADELPHGYREGFRFEVPILEMPVYLPWLRRRLEALGGRVLPRTAASLDEALAESSLVINCTGLASRELAGDRALVPVRGQVVRVEPCGVEEFRVDDFNPAGITYVVPRSRDVVLGGNAEEGREDLEPDDEQTRAITSRCASLVPALRAARILSVGVGLRPYRPEVRVERELRGQACLVHNYGHGGAGVTLSWGCAFEVARLVALAHPASTGPKRRA